MIATTREDNLEGAHIDFHMNMNGYAFTPLCCIEIFRLTVVRYNHDIPQEIERILDSELFGPEIYLLIFALIRLTEIFLRCS